MWQLGAGSYGWKGGRFWPQYPSFPASFSRVLVFLYDHSYTIYFVMAATEDHPNDTTVTVLLLGDPGCGKSTFLSWATTSVAMYLLKLVVMNIH